MDRPHAVNKVPGESVIVIDYQTETPEWAVILSEIFDIDMRPSPSENTGMQNAPTPN